MVLSLFQGAFGVAAIVSCLFAIRAVVRHHRSVNFFVSLSGAFALAFFLSVPDIAPEMILLSVLMIVTGALLIPSENQRTTRELLDDDIEVFGDSTIGRRLKK